MPRLMALDRNFILKILFYRSDDSMFNHIKFNAFAQRIIENPFFIKNRQIPVFLSFWYRLWKQRRSKYVTHPDYVIAMGIFELIMVLTCNYKKSKKVVWLRGIFLHEKANKIPNFLVKHFFNLEKKMLENVDFIFTNGDDIAKYYQSEKYNIKVIQNGVDLLKWKPSHFKNEYYKPIRIAYVGRLNPVKGFYEFLEAATILSTEENQMFEFHIVGDGVLPNKYSNLISNNSFVFHGPINNDDLPALLSTFDVSVALTIADENGGGGGTSNALIEQMAMGLIIVAWDNIIFRQLLNETEAFFVKQKDIAKLKDAFIYIANNFEEANFRSKNAFIKAQEFSIDAKVLDYYNYFVNL